MSNSKSYIYNLTYGASKLIIERAQKLRKRMTKAEKEMWNLLNQENFTNYKFRRQHPIDIFIVDFYCHQAKLVIEIDGGYHLTKEQQEKDINRSAVLKRLGIKILRFTNEDVHNQKGNTTKIILETLKNESQAKDLTPD
ncbi:endonuclease domain-containing protein [Geofilum sp. OHC36d9]|uniref:endonuclease domain-containing protein n=1 Tax=Geofilum sp. OHC36d9 TaxID=3458413 RepID=UPI004034F166